MGRGLEVGEEVVALVVVSVDYLIVLKEQRYRYSIVQRQEDDAIDRTSWQLSGRLKVASASPWLCLGLIDKDL